MRTSSNPQKFGGNVVSFCDLETGWLYRQIPILSKSATYIVLANLQGRSKLNQVVITPCQNEGKVSFCQEYGV